MTQPDTKTLAETARRLAIEAGAEIMRFYREGASTRMKDDHTPVTEADEVADRLIVEGLRRATPDIPVLSEESVDLKAQPDLSGARFWLVDPLDGTKEFLNRTDEFTVNIALIEAGRPRIGVLYAPACDECYVADGTGRSVIIVNGAPPREIHARERPAEGAVVVASRFHRDQATNDFIAHERVSSVASAGSALKFGLIAKGEADLYPRFGRTMEWDTAAGHAVLAAAGGSVRRLDGEELRYGKAGLDNPHFIARGRD